MQQLLNILCKVIWTIFILFLAWVNGTKAGIDPVYNWSFEDSYFFELRLGVKDHHNSSLSVT